MFFLFIKDRVLVNRVLRTIAKEHPAIFAMTLRTILDFKPKIFVAANNAPNVLNIVCQR